MRGDLISLFHHRKKRLHILVADDKVKLGVLPDILIVDRFRQGERSKLEVKDENISLVLPVLPIVRLPDYSAILSNLRTPPTGSFHISAGRTQTSRLP